jgi:thiol-disulfide isomerase/thioredoxin
MNKYKNQIFKKVILLCISILLSAPGFAQIKEQPIRNLKIGDTIPDLVIKGLIHSSKKSEKVSDLYKSGLLIINFWATWCVPCLHELPLLDSLKNKFPQALNVVAVAYEDSSKVYNFLKNHHEVHVNNLLLTTGDKVLIKYFEHKYLPHNIWIDQHGVIKAITSGEEITYNNIDDFLKKKVEDLNVKRDNMKFDYTQPFHLGDSIFQYRSIFTKYIEGIPSGCDTWGINQKELKRIFVFNVEVLQLFSIAYKRDPMTLTNNNLLEVTTKDSIKFFRPEQIHDLKNRGNFSKRIDWEKDHLFCYDLTVPENISDTLFFTYMLEDLKRALHVSCKTEYRPKTCYVVSNFSGSKYSLTNFHSTHDTTKINLFKNQLTLQHATIKELVNEILGKFNV